MNSMTSAFAEFSDRPVNRLIWPGLLVLGPLAVVLASCVTLFFVLQHPDGLVASDYYKQGKAINAQLSQIERARELGVDRLSLALTPEAVTLRFPQSAAPRAGGASGAPGATAIEVTLAHPVDPERDIRRVLTGDAKGVFTLALSAPLTERRRVVVTDSPAHSWRVESLLVPPKSSTR